MRIPLVDLEAQYRTIKDEVDAAIQRVLDQGQFILGPDVWQFEEEIAACCGSRFAVGVASGTDALHLALLACGIGPGDEVISTPFTFIATAEAITHCGAIPVFVDINPGTCNIDTDKIEPRITGRTRAILPVHLYGQPADMGSVMELARKHGLKVIEDCAQALGAEYRGRKVGSIGDAGCLSFFPSKNLGAFGDGGMVVTSDARIAETVDLLRRHGARRGYYYARPGFNSRLDTIQAAVLRVKLKRLDTWNGLRCQKAALYSELLVGIDSVQTPSSGESGRSSFNYYTIRLRDPSLSRNGLREYLESRGIQTMVYYPLSLHLQEAYRALGYRAGDLPESELAQEQVLSLPMYPELPEEHVREVVQRIREFIANSEKRSAASHVSAPAA